MTNGLPPRDTGTPIQRKFKEAPYGGVMTPLDNAGDARRGGHRLPRPRRAEADESTQRTTWGVAADGDATRAAPPRDRDDEATHVSSRRPEGNDRMVGRFEIAEKIGEGGMGVVYRAIDTADPRRREVAVKVLRPHIAYDPDARTRLAREVDTLERVHHPNVAAVITADPHGERPYIATEYVPGDPLDKVVDERGPLGAEEMADLGRSLADAIRAIHAAGVVHRDLKPSNVLMVGRRPVLIDFGIAHIADDARLTSTGLVMGTPGYLSPELVEGAPVSTSTDWWGWAATLAFAAQGEAPFGRGPMPAVLDRVTRGQANLTGVDARLRPLLAAALSPVPGERPSAGQVVDQMERYARGEPTTVVPVREPAAPAPAAPGPAATSVMPVVDATRVAPVSERPVASRPQQLAYDGPTQRSGGAPQAAPAYGQFGQSRGANGQPQPAPAVPPQQGPYGGAPQNGARPYRPGSAVKAQSRPGEHDPRINLPPRSGTLQAMFLLWVGVTALVPVVGLVLLIVWNVAARFSDSTITQTVLRRYEAGRRKSDGAVAVASSPWHLLRALVSTLAALVLPALVFACVGSLVAIGWAMVRGDGVARAWWALPIVAGAVAGQWTMWRGAGSVGYRRGSRSVVRALVPESAGRIVAPALAGLGLFMLVGSFMQGGDISWVPLTGGITDPLAEYLPASGLGN